MIDAHEVEKAVNWIRDNAVEAGDRRGQMLYLREYRKHLKSDLMKQAEREGIKGIAAQEREAYASPQYVAHLEGYREACAKDEEIQWLKSAALVKIDAWRTMESTRRSAEDRV